MPGLLGSSRARSADVAELAKKLIHTDDQRLVELAVHGDFAAALVAAAGSPVQQLAQPSPQEELVVLVHGEILHCDRPNPVPERSAAFLREAYVRDPSCAFLARATGVFSGVILDAPRRRILLVSDPLGFGHLYYAVGAQRELLFATEQKCFPGFRGTWDVQTSAVEEFLREGTLCGATTWLKGVELLSPGHYALYDIESERLTTVKYWEPAHIASGVYDSYDEAKQGLTRAIAQAFERATSDASKWAIQLNGDFSSRMLLASGNAAGHELVAFTAADEETEDLLYARRACGVPNTIHFSAPLHGEDWFLKRAQLAWMADGANLLRLSLASIVPSLSGRNTLNGYLGDLTLGTIGIKGYDDVRFARLLSDARRGFGSRLRVWDNFCRQRFPFADPSFIGCALRADVAYLLDERLRADIALSAFPDYFTSIPVRGTGGRSARQLLNGAPLPVRGKKRVLTSYEESQSQLRGDPKLEALVWDLLAGKDALHRGFTDQKAAYAAFWTFFKGGEAEDREALVRYVSLEIWLRQLLRGELSAPLPQPRVERTRDAAIQVSVIVPAYNVEPYIGECLNSLTNQDLSAIEVLVVDDGSTDGTPGALKRFAQDPRIRVLTTANGGVYHARNRALELVRGRYVSFVDSDDYVHAAMLQKLVDAADRHSADVAFCDVLQFDADGELRARGNTLGFKADVPLNLTTTPEMISDGFTTLWNRVYNRDFLARHKLHFDERFRISADMLFLQEVLLRATTIVRVPKPLYYYRFATPNSLTSYDVRNAQYLTHLQITIELIDFWVRNKQFDRHAALILTKAIRNFLWNTHIDAKKLAAVFEELHRYMRKLRVSPLQENKIEAFERRVFQLLRSGDFAAFMKYVRPYRIKMVLAKGGELTRAEKLSHGLGLLKKQITRSLDLQIDKNPAKKRYKLTWPRARFDLTLNLNAAPAPVQASEATPSRPPPPVNRTVANLRSIRDSVMLHADLENSLRASKKGAKRRVLHFSNAFSLPSETFTYDVLTGLERDPRLDNYMMFFMRELPRERPFDKCIQLHGCSRAALENGEQSVTEAIDVILESLKPDLVHCHFGWVGIPLVRLLAERQATLPVVITMHGTDVNMWPARHAWYRDALKHIHQYSWVSFTTHTETYRGKLVSLGIPASRIEVIPNSFDQKFAEAPGRTNYEPGGQFRVISVARMDIWKGQEYLIQGFAKFLRECYPNTSLSLVGYGPQERALRALVEQLGIQEQVRFYGRVIHQEIPVLLRNHDVYVQASVKHPETLQEEGQPIALLEAIACGVPVIVTDTGAMAETVRVGNHAGSALVIPDKDSDAIARALDSVRRASPDERTRRAYVKAICEKHNQEDQLRHTLQIYERAWSAGAEQASEAAELATIRADDAGLGVVDGTR
jgi:glycosyltransferase involved in cell wall biosynthesis